ncbi:unnamed protein product [Hermetia illucens]|uniref:Uncharacterized protein n=1 Tax=Hermetia illucens TaxID=343691 RepID=A0A7R8YXY3_HERIL|nr:unnamed protein product [Hermetia illucens]
MVIDFFKEDYPICGYAVANADSVDFLSDREFIIEVISASAFEDIEVKCMERQVEPEVSKRYGASIDAFSVYSCMDLDARQESEIIERVIHCPLRLDPKRVQCPKCRGPSPGLQGVRIFSKCAPHLCYNQLKFLMGIM